MKRRDEYADYLEDYASERFKDLLKQRVIIVNSSIEDYLIEALYTNIEQMVMENSKEPITLLLNSSGGGAEVGIFIADYIKARNKQGASIETIALSRCMSAAFIIFCAGKRRYCYKNSMFLMHNCSSSLHYATTTEHASYTERMRIMDTKALDIIARACKNVTRKELEAMIKEKSDVYFDGIFANRKLGLITKLLS